MLEGRCDEVDGDTYKLLSRALCGVTWGKPGVRVTGTHWSLTYTLLRRNDVRVHQYVNLEPNMASHARRQLAAAQAPRGPIVSVYSGQDRFMFGLVLFLTLPRGQSQKK